MSEFVLKPSPIHGVGVFTLEDIPQGTYLVELFDPFELTEPRVGPMASQFGFPYDEEAFECPKNFHRMSIGWYMNESPTPNADYDASWDGYVAARDIAAGEEITVSYV